MKQSLNSWQDRWRSPAYWIAIVFGSGLMKPGPGTWGSLAGLAAGYGLIAAGASLVGFLVAILAISILGTVVIDRIEAETGVHDAPEIVIDEVAGMWIAMLPIYFVPAEPLLFVAAFVLFRLFDIWKPWPIGWLDRHTKGGFGVMLDDMVAGIFALVGIGLLSALL